MQYIDIIQKSIDYIEDNIHSEITANELADDAGFSLYHYYRIFQGVVGIPVVQFIIRRKLAYAIYEISHGKKVIDAALYYGFNTYTGFYKAFIREYGYPPTVFLKKYKANKPYKLNLIKEKIMISEKKLLEVLNNWDLHKPLEIKNYYYESSGIVSDNKWIINNLYILKVTTNFIDLKNHISVSKSLLSSGIYTELIIPTKENLDFYKDDDLYFSLYDRLDGECVKSNEIYGNDYISKSRQIGEIIGQLHIVLKKHDKNIICNEPDLIETLENWAIPITKKYVTLPEQFYVDYLNKLKTLLPKLPKQIIHRNPNPSNIIIKDNKLTGIIDFELSERNIRIMDPCYTSTAILSETFNKKDEEKLKTWIIIYKNIINGYDKVVCLLNEEKQAIPYIILANEIIGVAVFSTDDKYQDIAKINQKMLYWLYDNQNLLTL